MLTRGRQELPPTALLVILLAALGVGALTFPRSRWPGFAGDEATYLMAAESLAWDLDIVYERADFERFRSHWDKPPEGLILQRLDSEAPLRYAKSLLYPLAVAPFVRLSPQRGAAVANVLYLSLAAFAAAFALRRRIGPAAAFWVAVFLFGSVTFAHVFWAHADLFSMCLVALALALAFARQLPAREQRSQGDLPEVWDDPASEGDRRFALRWAAIGALLIAVVAARPLYAPLVLAVPLAAPGARRRRALLSFAAGLLIAGLALVGLELGLRGSWTAYSGQRHAFYSYTGFPIVDPLPADRWNEFSAARGSGSWVAPGSRLPFGFDARLSLWNGLYFLTGRHVGVLPYFLPLILGLIAFRRGSGRGALLIAAAAVAVAFLVVRPFNFYGGGGALANRYFLPLYPVFWFLVAKRRNVVWPALVLAAAAPFLYPLWLAPRGPLLTEEGTYRYVSPVASRWLPYETSQAHLKPSGREDVLHRGLWVKSLGPTIRPEGLGEGPTAARFRLAGDGGALLIGSSKPLAALRLTFSRNAPARLDVGGGEVTSTLFAPDGRAEFTIGLGAPRAHHRMWWMEDSYLYELVLRLPDAVGGDRLFQLDPVPGG